MRESLTVLAILLILVLTTALIGPHFVDWSAQRPWVEEQLTARLGRPVKVNGAIDITLLPTPRLELHDILMTEAPGLTAFSAHAVKLELSAMPLLRGDLDFVDADFDRAEATVALDRDGQAVLPLTGERLPGTTSFQHIGLHQSSLTLTDVTSGQSYILQSLDLDADAASLRGPFKGEGRIALAEGVLPFRFSFAQMEDGRTRARLSLDETGAIPQMELEGFSSTGLIGDGRPRPTFDGTITMSGHIRSAGMADLAWKVFSPIAADRTQAQFSALEVRLGTEENAVALTGIGDVTAAAHPKLHVNLSAHQLDVDRLVASQPGLPGAIAAALGDAEIARRLPFALDGEFATPLITFAGQVLPDARLRVAVSPGLPVGLNAGLSGPGRSSLTLDGTVEPGAAARFKGQVQAGTRDAPRLADWLDGLTPELARALRSMPFRRVELAGQAQISPINFSGSNLAFTFDRSTLNGALAYTRAVGSERPRLFADLASPALDLDQVPDLSGAFGGVDAPDLALALDARAVKVARLGDGVVDAGRIRAKLTRKGSSLVLESFAIDNLGGASMTAKGMWNGASGQIAGSLDAARLKDLCDLLRKIYPGRVSDLLSARAVALSPARISFAGEGDADGRGAASLRTLTVDGTAGATIVKASARPDASAPGTIAGTLNLDSPETYPLLRQFGLDPSTYSGAGRASLAASFAVRPSAPADIRLDTILAGTKLGADLKWALGESRVSGSFQAGSGNLIPLLRVFGLAMPDAKTILPLVVSGSIIGIPSSLQVGSFSGTLAGTPLNGALTFNLGEKIRIEGKVQTDRLSLASLTSFAIGPSQTPPPGALWSDVRFGPGLTISAETDLAMEVGNLEIWRAITGQAATFRLAVTPGKISIGNLAMQAGGGRVGAQIVLRRDGPTVALAGQLKLEAMPVRQPSLEALSEVAMDFTATGTSAAALMSGLAGSGQARLTGARIPAADPQTLTRILAMSDQGKLTLEAGELQRTFARELDRGPFVLEDQAYDLTMAAGALRMAPAQADGPMRLALDLRNLSLDQRLTLSEKAAQREWTGAMPSIELAFKGNPAAPVREVEAGNFINDIAAREIARDTAKIAALEADIRERAAFNRRAKALKLMRQNEIDLQNFLAAEAKRALEDAKRAAEDDARRAVEDEKRKAADAIARRNAPMTAPDVPPPSPMRAPQPDPSTPPVRLPGAADLPPDGAL